MVKSSIAKTPFKKWLKTAIKMNDVYYQESRFIGTDDVMINLSIIDNLDDLKPAIVEVFGHLEGTWVHHINGEVEDMQEFELSEYVSIDDVFDPIDETEDDMFPMIQHSGFRTKRGMHLYSDLTCVPESLHFVDFHHTFKDGRCVYMTTMNEGHKTVIMLIDNLTNLTGKDLDVDFLDVMRNAWTEANPKEEEA